MLQKLKTMLYDFVVFTGVINIILPVLRALVEPSLLKYKTYNYVVKDESGATLHATRLNGRLYPTMTVMTSNKLSTMPDLKLRKDDILLCGYPKTGCHWMYELLYMLMSGKTELSKLGKAYGGMIDLLPDIFIDSLPSPRILNTHFLYEELPKDIKKYNTKMILTIRNPKDTAVSYYHHCRSLHQYSGKFPDFFKLFMEGNVVYGSYFDYTLAWDQVIRNQYNPVLLVSFEEMKRNPVSTVCKVARFLEISITDQFAFDVASACEFSKMKDNRKGIGSNLDKIFRKGQVNDWKHWLTTAQSEAVDKVWAEKMMGCLYQPQY